MILFVSWHFL